VFVLASDGLQVAEKWFFDCGGKHRVAILVALAGSDDDLVPGKVDVLDAEAATLHKPQPCSIEKHAHQPRSALQAAQQPFHLLFGQDDG
jgi:hypothetical protein